MAAKKPPGRNVEEWERDSVRVRIPREVHRLAERLAKHRGVKVAVIVEESIRVHVEAHNRVLGVE